MAALNKRILLVDDELPIRKLVTRYLTAAGYAVCAAVDGLDGIAKLRGGLPDLIISDVNMPRMSGSEFLGIVHQRFPQIPTIAISGLPIDEFPGVAADAFWQKGGFVVDKLLETVSNLTANLSSRTPSTAPGDDFATARLAEATHYVVRCQDCLREFNVARAAGLEQEEKSATCVHCGKLVHFSVAPPRQALEASSATEDAASSRPARSESS